MFEINFIRSMCIQWISYTLLSPNCLKLIFFPSIFTCYFFRWFRVLKKRVGKKINATISQGENWVLFYFIFLTVCPFRNIPIPDGILDPQVVQWRQYWWMGTPFLILSFFFCLADEMIATHYSYGFILETEEEGEDK